MPRQANKERTGGDFAGLRPHGRCIIFFMRKNILKTVLVSLTSVFFLLAAAAVSLAADRITAEELKALLEKNEKVVLIDVRTPQEHDEAHIPGSVLMPLDTLGGVTDLPEGERYIIYCRSGKRSMKAIEILSSKGFDGLTNLDGGIMAWIKSGGQVNSNKGR